MRWVCLKCRQSGPCSCGSTPSLRKIKEVFDKKFKKRGISLPEEDLLERRRGTKCRGTQINYQFGVDDGLEYIEYYVDWLIATPDLLRIYADGREKALWMDEGDDFYAEVRKRGLLYSTPNELPIYKIAKDDLLSLWDDLTKKRTVLEGDQLVDVTAGEILVMKKDGTLLKGIFTRKAEFPKSAFILENVTEKEKGKDPVEHLSPFLVAYSEIDKLIVLN